MKEAHSIEVVSLSEKVEFASVEESLRLEAHLPALKDIFYICWLSVSVDLIKCVCVRIFMMCLLQMF